MLSPENSISFLGIDRRKRIHVNLLCSLVNKVVMFLHGEVVAPLRDLNITAKMANMLNRSRQLVLNLKNAMLQCLKIVVRSENDLVVLYRHLAIWGVFMNFQDAVGCTVSSDGERSYRDAREIESSR